MSIKINNQNIVALYKGNQVITEVYKGLDLVWQLVEAELGMDDDIFFKDPEVGRVLKANGLIANAIKSSKRELDSITTFSTGPYLSNTCFFNNTVITKFPELKYCTGLISLSHAFYKCSNLTEVTIPDSITNMSHTFYKCSSLVNAPTIPESVTNMTSTFEECSSLVNAPTIPESVTNMSYTFSDCSNLTEAPTIPEGVTDMERTFSGCSTLTDAPIIPEGITNMDGTFYGCSTLTDAPIIPSNVTSMESTFMNCYNLINAPSIPNGVTNMSGTFDWCIRLVNAPIIPSSVTDMNETFAYCKKLINAPIIPEGVTDMGSTFEGCTSLDSVFVLHPVTPPIYDNTFFSVYVSAIYVPDESVDTYKTASGWSDHSDKIYPWDGIYFADPEVGRVLHANGLIANANKSSIEELSQITTLNPSGEYDTGYFYNNTVIRKFPELQYCTGLSDLRYSFRGCSNLTEIGTIPDSITNMTGTFNGCSSLTEVTIPDSVTIMGGTFRGCSNLTEVTIPDSVTDMSGTFNGCSSLTGAPIIPDSVTSMDSTFFGCTRLSRIFVMKPVTPPSYAYTFEDVKVRIIYVPDESVDSYKSASGWSEFADKILPMSGMEDYIVFADPEVGRVLHANGLIANTNKASKIELASITSLNPGGEYNTGYFSGNTIITKFPELQYCTGLSDLLGAFYGCSSLTEVTIPDSITNMTGTFRVCTSLVTAPIIPNSVTDMSSTFGGCSSLVNAPIIPDSVTSMSGTFSSCSSLRNAPIIPSSVTSMYQTFYRCTRLVNPPIIISEVVTSMYNTFAGCYDLAEAPIIPDSVTDMYYTFNGCERLVNAPTIPTSVTSMRGTFSSCSSLRNAPIIPSSVIDMRSTFYKCTRLNGIFIINPLRPPAYDDTFENDNVVSIYVPNGSVSRYKTASGWSSHSSIIYPMSDMADMEDDIFFKDPEVGRVLHANGLIADPIKSSKIELANIATLNPSGAFNTGYFYNNTVITKFPELQYCIGISSLLGAFRGCSNLTEAPIIPSNVTNMNSTFRKCTSIDGVFVIKPVTPPAYTNTFSDTKVVVIYVPHGSVSRYKTASGWSSHSSKIKPMSQLPK